MGVLFNRQNPMPLDTQAVVMAIDPGLNGAYAVLDAADRVVEASELPRFSKSLDAAALADLIRRHDPALVVVERVASRPGQGVHSTFLFGQTFGTVIGVVQAHGVRLGFVTPAKWKGHFRLLKQNKDAAREYAARTYPAFAPELKLKKHHGRADAILIARYAMEGGKLT